MSWTPNSARSLFGGLAIAAIAATLCPGTAFAGTIVVRSNGPSAGAYPPGKSLDPASSIPLKPGDSVTVLDSKGTHVLNGPGIVRVSGSGTASATGVAALLANTGARQSRTGATRSAVGGGAPHPTNVWYVDSSRAGAACVADVGKVAVWRPVGDLAGDLKITRLGDGKAASVSFGAGQAVRAWPDDLAVTDGASFKLEGAGLTSPTTVKIKSLESVPEGLDATAQVLLAKGCTNQIDLLITATKVDPGS